MMARFIAQKFRRSAFAGSSTVSFFNCAAVKCFDLSFCVSVANPSIYLKIFESKNHYRPKIGSNKSCIRYYRSTGANAHLKDCIAVISFFSASSSRPKFTAASSTNKGAGWVCHS